MYRLSTIYMHACMLTHKTWACHNRIIPGGRYCRYLTSQTPGNANAPCASKTLFLFRSTTAARTSTPLQPVYKHTSSTYSTSAKDNPRPRDCWCPTPSTPIASYLYLLCLLASTTHCLRSQTPSIAPRRCLCPPSADRTFECDLRNRVISIPS